MSNKPVIVVAGLIFSKDGLILLGFKRDRPNFLYRNTWVIPGGHVDKGETEKQALIREVMEEIGVNIQNGRFYLVDSKGRDTANVTLLNCKAEHKTMIYKIYQVNLNSNSFDLFPKDSDELENVNWFRLDNLRQLPLATINVELFTRMGYI